MLLVFFVSSARYYMWWGGASAPARFLVPLVPLLAPMVAAAFAVGRGAAARTLLWTFGVGGVLISAVAIAGPDPWMLLSDPHGAARLMEIVQGSGPLTAVFPTFTDENWRAPLLHTVPWIAAAAAALIVVVLMARLWPSRFWLAIAEGTTFLAVAAVAMAPVPVEARAESVTRGRFALMRAFDPGHLRTFDYGARSKLSPAQWIERSAVAIDFDPSQPVDGWGRLVGPLTLTPGEYQVKIWFQGNRSLDGDLLLAIGRGQALGRVVGPLMNPTTVTLHLPVSVPQLWVQLTEVASAQRVIRLEMTPTAIVPVGERPEREALSVDTIPGRPYAYMVYTDEETFPENGAFWTRGTESGQVLVVPAGGRQILLTLHVGPVGGTVRVTAGNPGRREDVVIEPEGTRTIAIPVGEGAQGAQGTQGTMSGYVPISIQASASFRPAEVEPKSSDTRNLGCQVRVEVR